MAYGRQAARNGIGSLQADARSGQHQGQGAAPRSHCSCPRTMYGWRRATRAPETQTRSNDRMTARESMFDPSLMSDALRPVFTQPLEVARLCVEAFAAKAGAAALA